MFIFVLATCIVKFKHISGLSGLSGLNSLTCKVYHKYNIYYK